MKTPKISAPVTRQGKVAASGTKVAQSGCCIHVAGMCVLSSPIC